jgi:superfamily II DNA or RNA helicase
VRLSATFPALEEFVTATPDAPPWAAACYFVQLLLRGQMDEAERFLRYPALKEYPETEGLLKVLKGDDDGALPLFEQGIIRVKRESNKRKVCLPGIACLFHLLALLRSGSAGNLKRAVELGELATRRQDSPLYLVLWMLFALAQVRLGNNRYRPGLEQCCVGELTLGPLPQLFHSLVALWTPPVVASLHNERLKNTIKVAKEGGWHWIAAEGALLRKAINPDCKQATAHAEQLFSRQEIITLAGRSVGEKEWERSLKALLALANAGTPGTGTGGAPKKSRLVWFVSGNDDHVQIQPVEQKQTGRGWTRGRNAALKRLLEENDRLDFLTPHDLRVIACINKQRGYGYYASITYEIDVTKALRALVGHPLVFNARDDEPLSIAEGLFTLEARRSKGRVRLTLTPSLAEQDSLLFRWEGDGRLLLYEPTPEQQRIAAIIGEGLTIPGAEESRIAAALTAISPHVIVHSDVAGDENGAESVAADTRLRVALRPSGSGIGVEILVRPFGEQGPGFFPGRGGTTLMAEVQGKRVQTSRDIPQEHERLDGLLARCATLNAGERHDDRWRLEEPEEALMLLEELGEAVKTEPDLLVVQWPEGERFRLRGTASWDRLKLSLRSGKEWFALEGEVAVSEEEVISLRQLMELMESGPGRFIQLAEGEFVALTEEFRRRLEELRRLTARHGGEQRFHHLMAPLVEESLGGAAGIRGDKRWKASLERFREADALTPEPPATLQATLREYQLEGFQWLGRLAHWGVGACLADDMGLGKTVQALALLIHRAPAGPALVLAPTSVCLNWESEAARFAPTLFPRIFGSGDRKKFVDELKPFDLVICSYTLFQLEAELLTNVRWETVVLDEAQAIKNMTTKRSQAAMRLNAGFRLATTGTPVENRLDELWNLFRFLNPGLLGSHTEFVERFATPIERDRDKNARNLLRRLIRPFILRRTKSAVLEELPPRTDIVQRVELSPQEVAFYEALRRKALETLGETEGQPPGERQIRILAEIMRLRRACCNSRLVMPECNIPSAKLALFREIVDELRENGHRALVFSQFVDHLSLLRSDLDRDGIPYQYLDGSTPARERQERVTAFQSGQGALFLISLKAGGVGLNLTAADYVIHMDPWWNPAVEDQASDRAHRMGQQRPVTVYRLVAANTIEEKIVALHHQKRDLADSLLEGTDSAARVSAEDLLELLREAG